MSEDIPRPIPDPLPDHPDLDWLRKQAKRHLKRLRNADPSAQLADAQFALAKQYGFSSWRALKAHVDSLTVDPIVSAALEQAERSAPVVRAAALLHLARVVNAFDHDDAEQLMERGLAAANVLREPDRSVILGEAVSLIGTVSPERALDLASSVHSDLPLDYLSKAVFDMISHGHIESAIRYLTSASARDDFPFDAALQALGQSTDDATRLQILRSAIDAARRQTRLVRHGGPAIGRRHFPFLFTRWWRVLPPGEAITVVQDLVQQILAEPDGRIRASWNDVEFTSVREHRLFEILAPLRHLAPALAASLVQQYPQLAAASARYPYGQESIAAAAPHEVGRAAASESVEQPHYILVGRRLVPIPEAVRTEFKEAFDRALRLYASDVDSGHPNDAPQECWPSTQEFRRILYKVGEHERRAGVRYLDRIPDPNLRLFAQIEFAAALVGLPEVGGQSISPGPFGFRQSMAMSTNVRHPSGSPMPQPPVHREPPVRKPDLVPSYEARITPTRRAFGDGPSGGSGPDFWVIEGARLRPMLAHLYDTTEARIDLPMSIENSRYDFTLILPQSETRDTMIRLMREGIERYFGVAREVKSMEVLVLTAPHGIKAQEVHEDDDLFSARSIGFATKSIDVADAPMDGPPPIPEGFRLMEIMDLHGALSAMSLPNDDSLAAMRNQFLHAALGMPTGDIAINSISQPLTMGQVCRLLESGLDRPLVDETRLTGTYAIHVHAQAVSTREFLRVICDRLGLAVAPDRRDVSILVVR